MVRIHGAEAGHLSRVLRGKPGDRVELVDGSGRTYRARLERVGADHAIARVEEEMPFRLGESALDLELIQGLPRENVFEEILRRVTELGVSGIQPVWAKRCQGRFPTSGRKSRWEKIIRESVKQCRRSVIPAIENPLDAAEFLARPLRGEGWILVPEGGPLKDHLKRSPDPPERLTLLVGPEGGWDPGETALARSAGYLPFSLGKRILRAETAASLMVALAQFYFGDFGNSL